MNRNGPEPEMEMRIFKRDIGVRGRMLFNGYTENRRRDEVTPRVFRASVPHHASRQLALYSLAISRVPFPSSEFERRKSSWTSSVDAHRGLDIFRPSIKPILPRAIVRYSRVFGWINGSVTRQSYSPRMIQNW